MKTLLEQINRLSHDMCMELLRPELRREIEAFEISSEDTRKIFKEKK